MTIGLNLGCNGNGNGVFDPSYCVGSILLMTFISIPFALRALTNSLYILKAKLKYFEIRNIYKKLISEYGRADRFAAEVVCMATISQ